VGKFSVPALALHFSPQPFRKALPIGTQTLLTFVSLSLMIAIMAFLKERRLRLAMQEILKRILYHWRKHDPPKRESGSDRDRSAGRHERV
tara:strand:- start:7 stop:276 length:270 start_codon:yes stop_codon:yes gene_type:complete